MTRTRTWSNPHPKPHPNPNLQLLELAAHPLVHLLPLPDLLLRLLALAPVVGADVLEVLEARLDLRLVALEALVQLRVERRQLAPVGLARALGLAADAQERLLVGRLTTVALLLQLGVVALRRLERAVPLLRLLPRRVALALDGLQLLLEAALVVASLRDAALGLGSSRMVTWSGTWVRQQRETQG